MVAKLPNENARRRETPARSVCTSGTSEQHAEKHRRPARSADRVCAAPRRMAALLHLAGAGGWRIRRPARRAGLVHDLLQDRSLTRQRVHAASPAQHDELECVEHHLVEFAAMRAETDRQQRRQRILRGFGLRRSRTPPASRPDRDPAGSVGLHHGEEAHRFVPWRSASRAASGSRSRTRRPAASGASLAIAKTGEHRHVAAPLRTGRRRER